MDEGARRPAGRRGVLVVDGASGWAPARHPLLGVWLDGALYLCTGPAERKAKNLAQNPNCALTTGCNGLDDGLDLVVEGAAAKVSDGPELRSVADTFESKVWPAFHGARRHLVRSWWGHPRR